MIWLEGRPESRANGLINPLLMALHAGAKVDVPIRVNLASLPVKPAHAVIE